MDVQSPNTLPKAERLCGKKGIERLLAKGRHGNSGQIRYIYMADNGLDYCRLLVSVPKKNFKRAVKRNLLKRRMREAYRLNRQLLVEKLGAQTKELDLALIYSAKELHSYKTIENVIRKVLEQVSATL